MTTPITENVPLDTPIQRGEQTITTITLRKPAAGELRGISMLALMQMDVDALTAVLPRISEPALTQADVRKMDPADLWQLGNAVAHFLLQKRLKPEESPSA